ncbi:sodium-coupled monocarboxylate transporter 1-like [Octopus vulgaris]|uniref:Sodium-coupled monocarboxylate transporter 1-like n=1 Tax=Octopus vulgaris TaxID=6645 RepID=A0AA36AWJ6_OCTVU|nr:sodium-coupled monocarboxylate transporter 1-like [Octopus vulgaris]
MEENIKNYSFNTGKISTFGVLDYVIFSLTLMVSVAIGIFYAIKDRHQTSTKTYLLAGGNMSVLPVALSLVASFMSAITLLGTPAEIYNFNTMFMDMTLAYIVAMFLAAYVYVPIFYRLHITSVYEYLEHRFDKRLRLLGSLIYCVMMIMYMAIVLYGPSLALNAVTGFPLWGAVIAVWSVSTFYTTVGGMKAVVWSDTFQATMMVIGLLCVLIQGSIEVGGLSKAWEIAAENHRIKFLEFSVDPRERHTIWAFVIGGGTMWASIYGTNQAQAQRTFSLPTLKKAQLAIWINFPLLLVILYLCGLIGVVLYAFYSKCDPLHAELITASDQLVPLFVMDTLQNLPGVPGMFLASIFSGTLSTIAAGMNSLSAVIFQDFLKPYCLKGMSDAKSTIATKILALCLGVLCLAATVGASKLGGILQAALALYGCLSSPMLGLFTLGMIFPWANAWGALAGILSSISIMTWISVGHYSSKVRAYMPPVSVAGCGINITTLAENVTIVNKSVLPEFVYPTGMEGLYSVSYLWYNVMAFAIVILVGLAVSFATGANNPEDIDPKYICPIFDVFCPCLPERIRKKLYFGVKHENKYAEADKEDKADLEMDAAMENDVSAATPPA